MTKQLNLVKNSFTLLETLFSITILAFIISGFIHSSYYDEKNSLNYMSLNNLENIFDTQKYKTLPKNSKNLEIIINDTQIKSQNVTSYEYKDENIKLIKYEK